MTLVSCGFRNADFPAQSVCFIWFQTLVLPTFKKIGMLQPPGLLMVFQIGFARPNIDLKVMFKIAKTSGCNIEFTKPCFCFFGFKTKQRPEICDKTHEKRFLSVFFPYRNIKKLLENERSRVEGDTE